MQSFMVVATFRPGTDMSEVLAVVPQEQAKVAELQAAGRIGAVYLATAERGTVFLQVFADGTDDALATVTSLPMAAWWDVDVYPLNAPVAAGAAS